MDRAAGSPARRPWRLHRTMNTSRPVPAALARTTAALAVVGARQGRRGLPLLAHALVTAGLFVGTLAAIAFG